MHKNCFPYSMLENVGSNLENSVLLNLEIRMSSCTIQSLDSTLICQNYINKSEVWTDF